MENWLQICVQTKAQFEEEVSAVLLDSFPSGLYVNASAEVYSICAYCPDSDASRADIRYLCQKFDALKSMFPDFSYTIESSKLSSEMWENVLRGTFKPIRCGKFYVKPEWEEYEPDDAIILNLNPGLAFGSGEHETTFMCLEAIDEIDMTGKHVLDYGCGSAILAIACEKAGAASVAAADNDPVAVEVAAENAERNNATVAVSRADCPSEMHGTYDVIVANIFASVLISLSKKINERCVSGGTLILSGIEKSQSADVEKCFSDFGYTLSEKKTRNEWVALVYCKK